jgi:hypothetical protein
MAPRVGVSKHLTIINTLEAQKAYIRNDIIRNTREMIETLKTSTDAAEQTRVPAIVEAKNTRLEEDLEQALRPLEATRGTELDIKANYASWR